jgi:hypothetical protein
LISKLVDSSGGNSLTKDETVKDILKSADLKNKDITVSTPDQGSLSIVTPAGYVEDFKKLSMEELVNLYKFGSLVRHKVPDAIVNALTARNMIVQTFEDASLASPINLDFYAVSISELPEINGKKLSDKELLKYIRLNISDLNGNIDFAPYAKADKKLWESDNPLGAVISIGIPMDRGSVVVSLSEENRWIFSTIQSVNDGGHPVSGHRQFGLTSANDEYLFYIMGADRLSDFLFSFTGFEFAFGKADVLWRNLLNGLVKFINDNKGSAKVVSTESNRYGWSVIKDYFSINPLFKI